MAYTENIHYYPIDIACVVTYITVTTTDAAASSIADLLVVEPPLSPEWGHFM